MPFLQHYSCEPPPATVSLASKALPETNWYSAFREPAISRAFILLAVASSGHAILLVHQVAAMQAVGLTVATASALAGARGLMQIPGRLLLIPLTDRAGIRGAMVVCFTVAATAALGLVLSGYGLTLPLVLYYVMFAGMSLGMLSALLGLFQADVYGDHRVGSLTGAAFVLMTGTQSVAVWLASVAAEWTGGYELTMMAVALLQASVILLLRWQRLAPAMNSERGPDTNHAH